MVEVVELVWVKVGEVEDTVEFVKVEVDMLVMEGGRMVKEEVMAQVVELVVMVVVVLVEMEMVVIVVLVEMQGRWM